MQNGKETGDKAFTDCKNGSAGKETCPGYARKACFSHETISEDNRDGTTTINYRRGCSHFEYEYENRKCNNYNFGIENVEECKDTCTTNDCNKEEIVVPTNCYTCDYTWDQEVSNKFKSYLQWVLQIRNSSFFEKMGQIREFRECFL